LILGLIGRTTGSEGQENAVEAHLVVLKLTHVIGKPMRGRSQPDGRGRNLTGDAR